MYFFINSEKLDVLEDGLDSESSPPYFLSNNDLVDGVVEAGSAYFFIMSDRGVDVDGVESPSSPYFCLKIEEFVDGLSNVFGSAGAANGDELLGMEDGLCPFPVIGDTTDGANGLGAAPVSFVIFSCASLNAS